MLCENCGKEFDKDKFNPKQRFCSGKCKGKKYRQEHREQIRERKKKYRREHREQIKEHDNKYTQEHREERKKYRREHREQIKEYDKKYHGEHREEGKIHSHKRRARIKGNGGSYTLKEIRALRKESQGFCKGFEREPHFVGEEALTIDHVIPVSKGGANDIENIQLLCKSCNSSKGAES